jgi:hypothetical protein
MILSEKMIFLYIFDCTMKNKENSFFDYVVENKLIFFKIFGITMIFYFKFFKKKP